MPRRKSFSFVKPQVIQIIGGAANAATAASNVASAVATTAEVAAPMQIDSLSTLLLLANSNPYLIGIFYLFLNLGGRYLSLELTKRQEWVLSQPILRPFILFAVMFISTRNMAVAFWTTVGILSVLWVFANENSDFCLIPGWKEGVTKGNNYDDIMANIKKAVKGATEPHDDGNDAPQEVKVQPVEPEAHKNEAHPNVDHHEEHDDKHNHDTQPDDKP